MENPLRRTMNRLGAAALGAAALLLPLLPGPPPARAQEPARIRVLATTTDLREIAREVGGDAVEVSCLTRGPEDPHFLDARPSFVRLARDAELFVKTGMDLEVGYEGPIVLDARNPRIQPGKPGHCDASVAVDKLDVPTAPVDRSMGDVHAQGNPHYLLDPVRAKTVAATVADALAAVDPKRADAYRARSRDFARRVEEAMFGVDLLKDAPARRLERLLAEGRLLAYLDGKGWRARLGGWASLLAPHSGAKVVDYHRTFAYLLDRFAMVSVASLEPKPGVPPTPLHARSVGETMKATGARFVLCSVFQPKGVAESVAAAAGGRVLVLPHMPGALPRTEGYLESMDAAVRELSRALKEEK
jgi:zinc/manganese transport system substrate-binding protein